MRERGTHIMITFKDVGLRYYQPNVHALRRAKLRFNIDHEDAFVWINDLMKKAKLVTYQNGDKRNAVYVSDYLNEKVTIIADDSINVVKTLYPTEIKTDFLRPVLERELRKIKREYTRAKRNIELKYAESLRELAEMAINRAKACNPQTRELIAEKISDKQAEIDEYVRSIERLDDEYKAKIRAIELIAE